MNDKMNADLKEHRQRQTQVYAKFPSVLTCFCQSGHAAVIFVF